MYVPCLELFLSFAYWRLDDEMKGGENSRLMTATLEQRNQSAQPVRWLAVIMIFITKSKLNWIMLVHKRLHQLQSSWPLTHQQWLVFSERELKFMFAIGYRPSVCLSSVCNVRAPYSGDWNFRQYFYAMWYLGHSWPSYKNFTEIVPGKPLRRGVKHKRGSRI